MRILFATDGSPSADAALDALLALPLRPDDHVTVLAVPVHPYAGVGFDGAGVALAEVVQQEAEAAQRVADGTRERIAAKGIPASARVEEGGVAETIIETAEAERAGLIVMGSRGLGRFAGALLGSAARAVARHSPIPVLVVRDRRTAPTRILVATDGSEDAQAAIRALADLPLPPGLEVTLLHVLPEHAPDRLPAGPQGDELRARMEQGDRERALAILAQARDLLPPRSSTRLDLERGRPAERILDVAASAGTDLIVVGARGSALRGDRFFQGSTSERLLESAHCAVLVARAPTRVKHERPLQAAAV